jgi:hypothetical protein
MGPYAARQAMDADGPAGNALGARDAVQQRSTATVEPSHNRTDGTKLLTRAADFIRPCRRQLWSRVSRVAAP